jgi:hypothetical protein
MEWIIWVIVIVLIIAVVWWLLNRNSGNAAGTRDAGGTDQVTSSSPSGSDALRASPAPAGTDSGQPGMAAATGSDMGTAAAGAAVTDTPHRGETAAAPKAAPLAGEAPARQGSSAAGQASPEDMEPDIESWDAATPRPAAAGQGPSGGDVDDWDDEEDKAEWDTQWSKAGSDSATATADASQPAEASGTAAPAAPLHHAEYTEPHAPTLPGAESAAAEALDAEAETRQRMESSAATEAGASHDAEPVGHQEAASSVEQPAFTGQPAATESEDASQPYGEGSAASAADGSGPDGYTVKADTGSMTYYDEDNPGYDDARAEVWFLSPAHAEAAGFRAPRRTRR